MAWRKLGRIFEAPGGLSWSTSHAAVPLVRRSSRDTYDLFFTVRDAHNRSHTGRAMLQLEPAIAVIGVESEPVLAPGSLGEFDDAGAMACWIAHAALGREFMYYVGWNLAVSVPFRNAIGLAISEDEGRTFRRYSRGPIIDRDTCDPFFVASACVVVDNDLFRMWYVSCVDWRLEEDRPKHRYHIKYAESTDGIRWHRTGIVAIDFSSSDEYAIARPSVLKDGSRYRMWYSYRGDTYRIGYAESNDGISWQRRDDIAGIEPGPDGWDSEMIEYPFVFEAGGDRFMLYNGNGYGRTGIGLARFELGT